MEVEAEEQVARAGHVHHPRVLAGVIEDHNLARARGAVHVEVGDVDVAGRVDRESFRMRGARRKGGETLRFAAVPGER